jgi:hypothetical protein
MSEINNLTAHAQPQSFTSILKRNAEGFGSGIWVVYQFGFNYTFCSLTKSTISPTFHKWFVTPASIAGVQRSV